MTRTLPSALVASVLALLCVLAPSRAAAVEKQWHVGGELGYAYGAGTNRGAHGFGGDLHLAYGLSDAFDFLGELVVTAHPGRDYVVGSANAGVGYVVDILQWVPRIGAVAGIGDIANTKSGCGVAGAIPCHSARLDLAIPFGVDYLVTRNFSVGVAGRYQLLLFGDAPLNVIGGFAKIEYLWGY